MRAEAFAAVLGGAEVVVVRAVVVAVRAVLRRPACASEVLSAGLRRMPSPLGPGMSSV